MTHSRQSIFKDVLVPTGQALEVLSAVFSRLHVRDIAARNALADARETLNLAAVYAASPQPRELYVLTEALNGVSGAIRTFFESTGKAFPEFLRGVLTNARLDTSNVSGRTTSFSNTVRKALPGFITQTLAQRVRVVREAIGYEASRRQAWLDAELTFVTPLTAGRRTNRWRTFVRHLDWAECYARMGLTAMMDKRYPLLPGVGDSRIAHANALWQATFDAEPVCPTESKSRLPQGVSVGTNAIGLLEVSASFNPASLLSRAQTQALATHRSRPEVAEVHRTTLGAQRFAQTSDLEGLAATVKRVSEWYQTQMREAPQRVAKVEAVLQQCRMAELISKFDRTFGKAERDGLLDALLARRAAQQAEGT